MFERSSMGLLKECKRLWRLPVLENFRAKHHNAQHLGQIPKAVTGAACPTLAQPQLTEMDSPEWNETHKAPCTPRQRLYQTKINGRQHSLWAPKLQGQIQYLGGLWESLIGLGCVCVRLASFNQVSQQQTLGVKWCVSGSEAFQAGQKVGEAVGLRAQPSPSLNVSQFSSGAQKAFALPAVKLADGEPLKSPTTVSPHKTAAFTQKELTEPQRSPYRSEYNTFSILLLWVRAAEVQHMSPRFVFRIVFPIQLINGPSNCWSLEGN